MATRGHYGLRSPETPVTLAGKWFKYLASLRDSLANTQAGVSEHDSWALGHGLGKAHCHPNAHQAFSASQCSEQLWRAAAHFTGHPRPVPIHLHVLHGSACECMPFIWTTRVGGIA